MIKCYHLYFKLDHDRPWRTACIAIGIAKLRADENIAYFGKFEGYILSGIGSRSVPVDRQAGCQTKT